MTRECQVRICERLGVKLSGPTRPNRTSLPVGRCPLIREDRKCLPKGRNSAFDPRRTVGPEVPNARELHLNRGGHYVRPPPETGGQHGSTVPRRLGGVIQIQ